MVSSEGGVVDCSVGSIVWVRRRNGSWWPGKILGPGELSSSLLTSPRSGTPVKLLGREDASVDWYNLEKSKRVKDFRCGDFDECIERAEAANGMPPKKREKYARREDAILHALELEKQLLEKRYGKLGHSSNGRYKKSPNAVTSSGYMEYVGRTQENLRSDQVGRMLGSETNITEQYLYEAPVVEGDQLSGDDDSPDALPRMRGLQEFGLRTASRIREEPSGVGVRTKRSRYNYLPYDSADSSNENQIRSSRMGVQLSKFKETGEDRISQSTEDTETDCSETDSMVSDSDDDLDALSDLSASIELRPKYPGRMREDVGGISSSEEFDEVNNDLCHNPFPYMSSMSKWELKGKRNSRMLGKRSSYIINGDDDYKYSMRKTNDDDDGERVMLVEVDLSVEGNNYRRDVPMTSVMSKLNGHAIIGHPIRIEPLENGFSGKLVGPADALENSALSPVWRTGRRTANSRVPRPLLSATLDCDAINHYGKFSRKKSSPSSSNQKIRTLSSIALQQNHHRNSQVDTNKSEYVPPTVACIPVNLVFSRLHEELVGRHP